MIRIASLLSGLFLPCLLFAQVQDDAISVNEDNVVSLNVTLNDSSPNGIDASTVDLDIGTPGIQTSVTLPEGEFTAAVDGVVTFTPALNFFGIVSVAYGVNDGTSALAGTANLEITVNSVNDPPVITGQQVLSLSEDGDLTVQFTDLTVNDPDNAYPTGFTLQVLTGTNYSVSGTTISPNINFSGILTVPVQVNDGTQSSAIFNLSITVNSVNDLPSVVGQSSLVIAEDQSLTIALDQLTVTDIDNSYPDDFTLTVESGTNYSFTGNTITPTSNYFGPLSVMIRLEDGSGGQITYPVVVTVTAVNDAPVITSQDPLIINEDQSLTITTGDLVVNDPDNTYPTGFTLEVQSGANFTLVGNTITPALNFSGSLSVPVRVNDGSLSSNTFNLVVSVQPVNDNPVITGQQTLSVTEDNSLLLELTDLTVTDVDNNYPDDFTLTVNPGANYTVTGNTVHPNPNFFGTLSVGVTVNDGSASSSTYTVLVTVSPVNDPPVIISQQSLTTSEDTPLTLLTSNFSVTDPDNTYPTGFSLLPGTGANYTVSGTTITPALNFFGTLTVPLQVSDGAATSSIFDVTITVNSVNDAPVVTGQNTVSWNEDNLRTIVLGDLLVTDPDDTYPTGFSLEVQSGTNYTFSGNTITPATNFSGTLTIPVRVNDGVAFSNVFNLTATILAVNDVPVITSQATITINEDNNRILTLSDLAVTDPDNSYPTGFSLEVTDGTNYSVSGTTVIPDPDFAGTLTVPVRVNDGAAFSSSFNLTITVTPINDQPVITGQASISLSEDGTQLLQVTDFVVDDPDNIYPAQFTLQVLAGTNYTRSGNTIIPAANFNGTLTVPVTISDGSVTSPVFNATVTVIAVNDAPVITGQNSVTLNEDQSRTITLSDVFVTDVDNTFPTGFSLTVLAGTNYTHTGNLVTPTLNFNGTLSVNVQVSDGTTSSSTFALTITVIPVNDAPVITGQGTLATNEDVPYTLLPADITVSDPDNAYPAEFSILVLSGSNYSVSGSTITPNLNFNGTLTVGVRVNDGSANSNTFNVTITVNSVNDLPQITGQNAITINEDQSRTIQLSDLFVLDPDNAYPTGFTLTVLDGSQYTHSSNVITPALNFNGTLQVNVQVSDGAGTSNIFQVQIVVNPVNDAPVITGQNPVNTPEDIPITLNFADLLVTDPDNAYPTGFTMTLLAGANYSFSGTTVTPVLDFTGNLNVQVRVNDGSANSNTFTLVVTVAGANDGPTITGQNPVTMNEDGTRTIAFGDLTVTDPDDPYPTGFTLTVLAGSGYTFVGNSITPALNFNGVLAVNVRVNDGLLNSNTYALQVTVNPVNDVPVITGQNSITISEDQSRVLQLSDLLVSDPDDNYPTDFTLSVGAGANYTISGNTLTPASNYSGPLTVPVTVNDGSASSTTFSLAITVAPVNDPPVINGQNPISINEDQSRNISLSDLSVSDIDSSFPTGFSLTILSGINYSFSGTTIVPQPDFVGTLTVNVRVSDGSALSDVFGLSISVLAVNDPPIITSSTPVNINEDQSRAITFSDLQVTDVDNSYPTGFSISVLSGANYTVSGTTITPAANFSGTLNVNVRVNDGSAFSNTATLTVTVQAVNDVPAITGQNAITINEDNSRVISLTDLLVTDPDNSYPTDFTLTVLAGTNYSITGNTLTPALNFFGTLTVGVRVNDGTSNSNVFNLSISVNAVNDSPVITNNSVTTMTEDQSRTFSLSDFSVSDPDNVYPTGFTLSVLAGTNYSVSGNSVTPASNFTGILTLSVLVTDGASSSAVYSFNVTVNDVNDAPVVSGQSALAVNEDQNITLQLTDFLVSDVDNAYPNGFTMTILSGTNYTFSGQTVIPAANFSGTLTVRVRVNDGQANSNVFNASVTVLPVNDPPSIVGQVSVTILEDQSRIISTSDLIVNDIDNTYPTGFSVSLLPGTNYTVSGSQITPAANFNGNLSVSVLVSDGAANSAVYSMQVGVTPVNDAPVITGQSTITLLEDQSRVITLSDVQVSDVDSPFPTGFTLKVLAGTGYTFTGNTIQPQVNLTGNIQVNVLVNDGLTDSAPFQLVLNFTPVNDVPVITSQKPLVVDEDASLLVSLSDLVISDPDNVPGQFTFTLLPGTNYVVSGSLITPVANFFGSLSVGVKVNDGSAESAVFNLVVTINQINDAPSFTLIPNQTVLENAVPQSISITGVSRGPLESSQSLTLLVSSGNTTIIPSPTITYNGTGTSATLNYSVAPNRSGVVTLTVTAIDNGSNVSPNQNSFTQTFTIDVQEVNNAPTLDVFTIPAFQEDGAIQTIALSGITAGPFESQGLTVTVSSTKPELYETLAIDYSSPSATAVLRIKPAPNVFGSSQITVKVTDNGSGTSPNVNQFSRTVTSSITSVNDLPVFISTPILQAEVGVVYEYLVQTQDVENETMVISEVNKPSWLTLTSLGNGLVKLSGTPPAGSGLTATVKIQVKDPANQPVFQEFTIQINTKPIVSNGVVSTPEDIAYSFSKTEFESWFVDQDGGLLQSVIITKVPDHGNLQLNGTTVGVDQELSVNSLNLLKYTPQLNYFGPDTVEWKGTDGISVSLSPAVIGITVTAVNDPPQILFLEADTLEYEIGSEETIFLTSAFQAEDVDGDQIVGAEIGFRQLNFRSLNDRLAYTPVAGITGTYNELTGTLVLSGTASVQDYVTAIRNITYNYTNVEEIILDVRKVYITLSDSKANGETRERSIGLVYNFKDLDIPTVFTPNGDGANDLWKITSPLGIEQYTEAVVRVFDSSGRQVFSNIGFTEYWNGKDGSKELPQGVYFYSIVLNYNNVVYKGAIYIVK